MTLSDLALVAAMFLIVSLIREIVVAKRRWARLDAAQGDSIERLDAEAVRLRVELASVTAQRDAAREDWEAQWDEIRRLQDEINKMRMRESVTPPPNPTESTRLLLHEFGKILVDVLHGTPRDGDDDEYPDTPDDPNAFTVIEEPEVEWMDLDDYDELEGRVGGITLPRDLAPDEIDVATDIEIDPDMG